MLRALLTLCFLAMLLLAATASLGLVRLSEVKNQELIMEREVIDRTYTVWLASETQFVSLRGYLLMGDQASKQAWQEGREDFERLVRAFPPSALTAEDERELRRLSALHERWWALGERIISLKAAGQDQQALRLMTGEGATLQKSISDGLEAFSDQQHARVTEIHRQTVETERRIQLALLGTTVLALPLLIALGYVSRTRLAAPLLALETAAGRLGAGETAVRVTYPRNDEFGALAAAFNQMADQVAQRTEALRESEERYRGLFDTNRDAIMIADPERRLVDANPAFTSLFGYALDEVRGQDTCMLYAEREHYERLSAVLDSDRNQGLVLELRYRRKNGETFPAETAFYLLRDASGAFVNLVGVVRDVTERIEKERAQHDLIDNLRQIDRMKDEFLSILSHELRTPINAMMGFASILDDELAGPLNRVQHGYLQKILRGAEVLLALVNDLLDMSRIRAGKLALDKRLIRLPELAEAMLGGLESLAAQKDQCLINEVPADLPPVRADEQRIGQVLSNLVGNAVKFTPEGGTIRVRACLDGPMVRVEIEDTGQGLTPDEIPRLFKQFGQLDSSSTRRAGGVGLGLSICKSLIEAHGGEIGAESPGSGLGSTFWFTLPSVAEPPAGF